MGTTKDVNSLLLMVQIGQRICWDVKYAKKVKYTMENSDTSSRLSRQAASTLLEWRLVGYTRALLVVKYNVHKVDP